MHDRAIKEKIPLAGTFELTDRCNFNCKMCYMHSIKAESADITKDEWLEIARQAKEAGTIFLLLTGGEPLLRPDFEELYTALCEMGFVISVNTNGSLLCGKYSELFSKYPPSRINVTVYGKNSLTYKELCGNDCFDKVSENILKAHQSGLNLKINCEMTTLNASDCIDICKKYSAMGIPCQSVAYIFPPIRKNESSTGCNCVRPLPETAAFNKINFDVETAGKERIKTFCSGLLSDIENLKSDGKTLYDDRVQCRAGRSTYWVNSCGKMGICGVLPCETDILSQGFEKAFAQALRLSDEIRLPKQCTVCSMRKICNVCAAVCFCESGEFGAVPEYVCRFTKEKYKLMKEMVCNEQ